MARYRRRHYEMLSDENQDTRYSMAYRRVKKIKGFYVHLMVYILVNVFVLVANQNEYIGENVTFWGWENFSTPIFWGVFLAAHWFSVFGRDILFGKNWEERKIQEFMEQEKKEKWE